VSPIPDNTVHDVATLRIRNSGSQTLNISSLMLSSTLDWEILNAPAGGTLSLNPGDFYDLQVKFIANPGGTTFKQINGTLTINSNDADESAAKVTLSGWWQYQNEHNLEPLLQPLISAFGYGTQVAYPGQTFMRDGSISR